MTADQAVARQAQHENASRHALRPETIAAVKDVLNRLQSLDFSGLSRCDMDAYRALGALTGDAIGVLIAVKCAHEADEMFGAMTEEQS